MIWLLFAFIVQSTQPAPVAIDVIPVTDKQLAMMLVASGCEVRIVANGDVVETEQNQTWISSTQLYLLANIYYTPADDVTVERYRYIERDNAKIVVVEQSTTSYNGKHIRRHRLDIGNPKIKVIYLVPDVRNRNGIITFVRPKPDFWISI